MVGITTKRARRLVVTRFGMLNMGFLIGYAMIIFLIRSRNERWPKMGGIVSRCMEIAMLAGRAKTVDTRSIVMNRNIFAV
jgi:hypothetical protein